MLEKHRFLYEFEAKKISFFEGAEPAKIVISFVRVSFLENSLIEVGSRKKKARRRSGEAILGSKMGSKWEK